MNRRANQRWEQAKSDQNHQTLHGKTHSSFIRSIRSCDRSCTFQVRSIGGMQARIATVNIRFTASSLLLGALAPKHSKAKCPCSQYITFGRPSTGITHLNSSTPSVPDFSACLPLCNHPRSCILHTRQAPSRYRLWQRESPQDVATIAGLTKS